MGIVCMYISVSNVTGCYGLVGLRRLTELRTGEEGLKGSVACVYIVVTFYYSKYQTGSAVYVIGIQ